MKIDLTGKTALVTGGGAGIGRATSLALAQAGAAVVIGNRNEAQGSEVVEAIHSAGGKAVFHKTDVTAPAQVKSLVDRAVAEFGGLHLAFNNAGVEHDMAPLHELDIEQAEHALNVNVRGVFYSLKYELEHMAAHGGGAIVNNSSILGLKAAAELAAYNASKHAVVGLTRSAALDYAEKNIRVNAVAPGPIETRMLNDIAGGEPDSFAEFVPMGRIGQPEEIAAAVVWLLSDAASFVTGHTLPVDGGWNAK